MACSSSSRKSVPGGYLIFSDRNRSGAARHQIMFGKTHSFLPRNGMVTNTAHILLHLPTAATLTILLGEVKTAIKQFTS